jgi:hypothetical protein
VIERSIILCETEKFTVDESWLAPILAATDQCLRPFFKLSPSEEEKAIMAVSGRIEESDLPDLQTVLDAEVKTPDLTLDLGEVRLVNRGALRFLADCEAKGIKLKNCPAYIREWLGADRRIAPPLRRQQDEGEL